MTASRSPPPMLSAPGTCCSISGPTSCAQPRKTGYENLTDVTTNGDYEVTFKLKAAAARLPDAACGGFSAIYPCHIKAEQMRQHRSAPARSCFVEFSPIKA